jgi:hypothetical protein
MRDARLNGSPYDVQRAGLLIVSCDYGIGIILSEDPAVVGEAIPRIQSKPDCALASHCRRMRALNAEDVFRSPGLAAKTARMRYDQWLMPNNGNVTHCLCT